ncbi:hypothetical protein UFOVP75_181 [uncultured Caudovirales phage]|uniref:Uncharacterized protein n=1 Tax=uncultured Caudovirales phage TaxID=2100421 RepID=A0A6J5L2F7_9CAUD|nr:hypothetical protein UFOVP75_181 [uncultured Caudovirales phage]
MPFTYDVLPNSYDSHQSNPYWFGLIVRFNDTITFDIDAILSNDDAKELDIGLQNLRQDPVLERPSLILSSSITSWSITQAKASHVSTASFRIAPGGLPISNVCQAGDWFMFWAFDNAEDYERVLANVEKAVGSTIYGDAPVVNGFSDGLKFIGRLNSPRIALAVDQNGTKNKNYQLTAVGFGEFDSKIYFTEAQRARYESNQVGFMAQIHDYQENLDKQIAQPLPFTTSQFISLWLEIFLGAGPGTNSKGLDPVISKGAAFESAVKSGLNQSPNDKFLIPRTIAKLLGVTPGKGAPTFLDILNVFVGVQAPTPDSSHQRDNVDLKEYIPKKLCEPLGSFLSQYQDFRNVPVWDILSSFQNHPLNEMYVTLRANADGVVRPTFMLRQIPFSSRKAQVKMNGTGNNFTGSLVNRAKKGFVDDQPDFAAAIPDPNIYITDYTKLPRWRMSDSMVLAADVGPSDSLRINFVKIQGRDLPATSQVNLEIMGSVLAPAMADINDIKRNGLRPYIGVTNCDLTGLIDQQGKIGRAYTQIMADVMFGQHLKWTGSLKTMFIQEPICVGDNLQYDNVLYHIESVVHSGSVAADGHKTSDTTFSLSNGISVDSDTADHTVYPFEIQETNDGFDLIDSNDHQSNIFNNEQFPEPGSLTHDSPSSRGNTVRAQSLADQFQSLASKFNS